jgi:hypothetical protein
MLRLPPELGFRRSFWELGRSWFLSGFLGLVIDANHLDATTVGHFRVSFYCVLLLKSCKRNGLVGKRRDFGADVSRCVLL